MTRNSSKAKRVVFVIAQQGFRDEELLQTQVLLRQYGISTVVAAKEHAQAIGKLGTVIMPDMTIEDIVVADYDGIVFVGGPGVSAYIDDVIVLKLVQAFYRAGKVVAAICAATSILANAGVLLGKQATGFPTEEQYIRDRGADYTGMPVVVDGLIITGKDYTAASAFAQKIIAVL